MKGVNVLFEYGRYIVFIDPLTDYLWIYDNSLHEAIYIFTFVKKIKDFFR